MSQVVSPATKIAVLCGHGQWPQNHWPALLQLGRTAMCKWAVRENRMKFFAASHG